MLSIHQTREFSLGPIFKLFADNWALGQIIGFVCRERKQAISPSPAMFSLAFCLRAVKKRANLVWVKN